MQNIASLWIGDHLSDIELASIASFRRFGHSFTVYSYEPVRNLPEGVIARDAASILPARQILRYWRGNTPAIHADVFRYAMLAQSDNVWVDLDMIALKPFLFPTPWIFAFEDSEQINNAVLGLPRESRMLAELGKLRLDTRGLPPHLKGFRRFKYGIRGLFTGGVPISRWPWASTGPRMVTHFSRKTGEVIHALPPETFYSIPHSDTRRFLIPGALEDADLPDAAFGVHLWGGELRRIMAEEFDGQIPPDSFLGRYVAAARQQ